MIDFKNPIFISCTALIISLISILVNIWIHKNKNKKKILFRKNNFKLKNLERLHNQVYELLDEISLLKCLQNNMQIYRKIKKIGRNIISTGLYFRSNYNMREELVALYGKIVKLTKKIVDNEISKRKEIKELERECKKMLTFLKIDFLNIYTS